MKKQDMLVNMSLIDDKYVSEASTDNPRYNRKARMLRFGAFAACFAIIVGAINLWLFVPKKYETKDISAYADSEYYPIIEKISALNSYSYEFLYKNNYEMVSDKLYGLFTKEDGEAGIPTADDVGAESVGTSGNPEITDNQVAGVIEADMIKRTNSHIFYLSEGKLRVYSIKGEESEIVCEYSIEKEEGYKYFRNNTEFYISSDSNTLIVVDSYSGKIGSSFLDIISLDISDPTSITEKKRVRIDGSYLSSRLTNGSLLILSGFSVSSNPNYSNESEFIPQIDTGNGAESIPYDSIVVPDRLTSTRYTVISKLDETTLSLEGSIAYLSSDAVYVSADSVYLARAYTESVHDPNDSKLVNTVSMTEISRLSYSGDGLLDKGSVSVKGSVKDQYSIDEYESNLRVVTTTQESGYREIKGDYDQGIMMFGTKVNASLYIISLDEMKLVSSVEKFAPEGERVQSVRFDGKTAYVCTSVFLSDPVFFFDLSDIYNISYKDTGNISGFSSSLINMGEGYLLGIGRGDSWNVVKVEVYEESENSVISVDSYTAFGDYSTDYKSYYVDREHGLFGFGMTRYPESVEDKSIGCYVLLQFDGYRLTEVANIELSGSDSHKRAVYIDGYLYVFAPSDFRVEKIS